MQDRKPQAGEQESNGDCSEGSPCPSSRPQLQMPAACLAISAHGLQLTEDSPLLMGALLVSFSQGVLLVVECPGTPAVTPGLCI